MSADMELTSFNAESSSISIIDFPEDEYTSPLAYDFNDVKSNGNLSTPAEITPPGCSGDETELKLQSRNPEIDGDNAMDEEPKDESSDEFVKIPNSMTAPGDQEKIRGNNSLTVAVVGECIARDSEASTSPSESEISMSGEYSEIEIRVKEIKDDNDRLYAALRSNGEVMKKQICDMNVLLHENKSLKSLKECQTNELILITERIQELEKVNRELDALKKENSSLKGADELHRNAKDEMLAVIEAQKAILRRVNAEKEQLQALFNEKKLQQSYSNDVPKLEIMKTELESMRQQNEMLTKKLEIVKLDAQELLKSRNDEEEDRAKLMAQMSNELDRLRFHVDQNAKYEQLDMKNEIVIQDMTEQLVQLNGAKAENENLNIQLRNAISQLNEALTSVQQLQSKLSAEAEEKMTVKTELVDTKKQVDQLKKEKIDLEERLERGTPVIQVGQSVLDQREFDVVVGTTSEPYHGRRSHRRHRHSRNKHVAPPSQFMNLTAYKLFEV